ncbi:protein translocase subunit SecF [Paenibacillus sp. sgz302251]|uniref:protein translocase subunit SecF n=1 Tax=Paenibacillus sp. sgz302251 TaxID=3414493 RepID=UPI003C7C5603
MRFNRDYSFIKNRRYFFIFSIAISVIGAVMLAVLGLNYGVDFKAGSNVDIAVTKSMSDQKAEIEQYLSEAGFSNSTVTVGADRVGIRFDEVLQPDKENQLKIDFASKFDPNASMEVNTVDVEMARELQMNALIAMLVASLGIIVYIAIRFEWRFAIAAIISLAHDAFIVISVFSILRLEVNLPFIVAVLTIIGYSINDTIVVFDRIRENLRFSKIRSSQDLAAVVDSSIWQTMARSINTVITVIFAALCLYIFGSESLKMFSLAMLIGLISGGYSSVFIASPIWYVLKNKEKKKKPAINAQTAP